MPIGNNKNENDGTSLNENLSGLTISDKKNQQQQPTSSNGSENKSSVYVPPSKRNTMKPSGAFRQDNNNSNNGSYNNGNSNYPRQDNNQSNKDNYPSNNNGNNNYSRQDNNNSNNNYNNNNNNGGGRYDSPRDDNSFSSSGNYNKGGYNNYSNNGGGGYSKGGYNNYSSPSFSRQNNSPFNRNNGGYKTAGGSKYDRYYERWQKYKDTRHFPELRTEIKFDLDDTKVDEIFKSKQSQGVGINFDSYDDDDISIETSENICTPLNSFTDVDLGDILLTNIKYAKYTKPTPVQKSALPIILKDRDLMACAQTGSGKTAAFLFPIISGILLEGAPEPLPPYKPGLPRPIQPRALVLAPTRELAQQIFDEANKFSHGSPVTSVVIYGGADVSFQISELDRGCDILVATTGRLVDLLTRGKISLSKIKYLVLDEADRMLDMGFEPQIRQIIANFDMNNGPSRQTLMFSATFPKPIQNLASDFLNNFIFLKVGVVGTTQNITQRVEYVTEDEKNSYLLDYLSNLKSDCGLTLIFVETKRSCDTLTYFLNQRQFPTTCIHGDLSQNDRENALHSFRSFQTPFLVATDIASRGLHIPNVMYVINYDLPNDIDVYVHRIGRTGRAGKKGFAVSFFNDKNKPIAADLNKLLKISNQEVPDWFEKVLHSFKSSKAPMGHKSNSPFQKSYHNNNYYNNRNDRRQDDRNDRNDRNDRRPSNNSDERSNDYTMHNHFFTNNGGSYN
ncbi:putative RNA helicase [Tieghemostelium lacteum]|uniref:RNA helicase n=1 Tax=Tieghemostelium lacteum TaxID=361077 RepID=A0A151ZJX7_TIELA|nr:putative RNA helicase [Tieghemostelium lacteum]|eukprot:KYQ94302.1 putative RNA helicase [Tieghemostelium lacteum]